MKSLLVFVLVAICLVLAIGIHQFLTLRKAHSSFENYYAFRGCVKLIKRTSVYGICRIAGGKTIKIVEVHSKWYLDGDLPVCYGNFCL